MSLTPAFIAQIHELLTFLPKVEVKRMFGGAGVYTDGMMFALAADEHLWLKSDDESDPLFEAEGLPVFVYAMKDGEAMSMAYRQAPDVIWDDEGAARHWVQIAIAATLRKKSKSKAKKKKTAKTKPGSLLISGPWDDEKG
jgi:DNA transformation protein